MRMCKSNDCVWEESRSALVRAVIYLQKNLRIHLPSSKPILYIRASNIEILHLHTGSL